MNQVQEALARVIGLSGVLAERDEELHARDDEISAQGEQLTEAMQALEHLVSDHAMLQRQIEDLDYLNLFETNQVIDILPAKDRAKVLARLRRLRHDNPLAKQAVKLVVRFTLGKGVQWILAPEKGEDDDIAPAEELPPPSGSNGHAPPPTKLVQLPRAARSRQEQIISSQAEPPEKAILDSFWNDRDNKLAFTTHKSMQKMLDDITTDGEKFYACFPAQAEPYLKTSVIPLEEINLILYNPDNRLQPVFYRRQYVRQEYDGKTETMKPIDNKPITKYYWDYRIREEDKTDLLKGLKVPRSKIEVPTIRHIMINEVESKSGTRGVSELYASREWFRVFREFMEGRASINAAANAISFIRKIKGGPSTVARFSGTFGGRPVGESLGNEGSELRKLTQPVPGAIYDTNQANDLEWMKTDTGALNAKEDARLLLMSAGSGVGMMLHYFGEGGDANLATAQSMELPMVKSFEDWQQFVEDFLLGWFEYVLQIAMKDKKDSEIEEILDRIGFTFPPIISQDVVKYTTSWSQIIRDIAPNNMVVKREAIQACLSIMGIANINGIMPQIEAEMARAEAMRVEQQQAMMDLAADQPPVAGDVPNAGMNPNLKRLASGKGEKAANGPKPA